MKSSCLNTPLLYLTLLLSASMSQAQGCSQCRNTIGQAPLQTQAAYRKAIEVMVFAGCCVFAGALTVFRRFR